MIDSIEKAVKIYEKELTQLSKRLSDILTIYNGSPSKAVGKVWEELFSIDAMESVLEISSSEREEIIKKAGIDFLVDIFNTTWDEAEKRIIKYWETKVE